MNTCPKCALDPILQVYRVYLGGAGADLVDLVAVEDQQETPCGSSTPPKDVATSFRSFSTKFNEKQLRHQPLLVFCRL